jgi:hypothetical protein
MVCAVFFLFAWTVRYIIMFINAQNKIQSWKMYWNNFNDDFVISKVLLWVDALRYVVGYTTRASMQRLMDVYITVKAKRLVTNGARGSLKTKLSTCVMRFPFAYYCFRAFILTCLLTDFSVRITWQAWHFLRVIKNVQIIIQRDSLNYYDKINMVRWVLCVVNIECSMECVWSTDTAPQASSFKYYRVSTKIIILLKMFKPSFRGILSITMTTEERCACLLPGLHGDR